MVVPPNHPQLNNFSIEPMVLGYPHFRKPPYVYIQIWANELQDFHLYDAP